MWNGRSIAVILPTYRERATIREIIHRFEELGIVDDIVVVNNNAEEGTSEQVAGTSAREIHEPYQAAQGSAKLASLRAATLGPNAPPH
jgi:glycosyltransferase involved in cell wall biosynthesis